jgi:integrase
MGEICMAIYGDLEQRVIRALESVKSSAEVTPRNKELIQEFYKGYMLRGNNSNKLRLTENRQIKLISTIRIIAEFFKKDFDALDSKDIDNFQDWLEFSKDLKSPASKNDYVIIFKEFLVWLKAYKEDKPYKTVLQYDVPILAQKLTKFPEDKPPLTKADLLTIEERNNILKKCNNPQERAFFSMLFESMCRIGEIGELKIKDVVTNKEEKKIIINVMGKKSKGKLQPRSIPLYECYSFVMDWLAIHPNRDNSEAWLWLNYAGRQLRYGGMRKKLKEKAKEVGITKHVWCHLTRKSRATELSECGMPVSSLCDFGGWVNGSPVLYKNYIAINHEKTGNDYREAIGMKEIKEKEKLEKLYSVKHNITRCSNCGLEQPKANRYCSCGAKLINIGVYEEKELLQEKDEIIAEQSKQIKELLAKLGVKA